MAERTVCPHCSFRNFRVSKFCARCEQPLLAPPSDKTTVGAALPTPAKPALAAEASPAERAHALGRRVAAAARSDALRQPAERSPRGAARPLVVPSAPTAPLVPEGQPPDRGGPIHSPLPRSRPNAAPAAEAPGPARGAQPPAVRRSSRGPLPEASAARHAGAYLIDVSLMVLVGVLWSLLETLVRGSSWPGGEGSLLTALAFWLHANAAAARHSLLLALAFATGHAIYGVRTGYTAGRRACGLLLVGLSSGQPTKGGTWSAAVWHSIGGFLSILSCGAGHFWLIVDDRHRTWPNVLGKTMIVSSMKRPRTEV